MRRLAVAVALVALAVSVPGRANAAAAPVSLGAAAPYSVLGGQTVTNTGPSMLAGVGVWPGSAITGFPPGTAAITHAADTQAAQAQAALTAAYVDAAGRPSTGTVAGDLVGQVIGPGVYTASSSLFISGTVTLDGQGDPNAVFIFQIGSTLISASASRVLLINGAQACNVFWQVGSSATLGTYSTFAGNILALTSITVTTGVTVIGRALARNGSTTLDSDTFVTAGCAAPPTGTTVVTIPATTPTLPPVVSTIGPPASTVPGGTTPTVPGGTTPTVPGASTRPGGTTPPTTVCVCPPGVTAPGGTSATSLPPGVTNAPAVTSSTGGSVTVITRVDGTCVCGSDNDTVVPCPPKQSKHRTVEPFIFGSGFGGGLCASGALLLRHFRRR